MIGNEKKQKHYTTPTSDIKYVQKLLNCTHFNPKTTRYWMKKEDIRGETHFRKSILMDV